LYLPGVKPGEFFAIQNKDNNMETTVTAKRHLAKAVTWRIIASVTTAAIAWAFGLPPKAVGMVFVADLIIKFVLYYAHERVWYNHIRYGVINENRDRVDP